MKSFWDIIKYLKILNLKISLSIVNDLREILLKIKKCLPLKY